MKRSVGVAFVLALLIVGCNNREDELRKQLSEVQSADSTMQVGITERDKFMEQILAEVNDAYVNLEQARVKEGGVAQRATGVEGSAKETAVVSRQDLLKDLSEISNGLQANQKQISQLQARYRTSARRIAGLDSLIENLKTAIQEREVSIAQLQEKVQGLETTVAQNVQTIAVKDSVIGDQQKTMNTAYYVIGTKDELKKKGILTDQGGFLWGLLGSTTVLADSIDESSFAPLDKTSNQSIRVEGKIDQILPNRRASTFAMAKSDSALTILSPSQFWKQKYLVIVVGG